MAGSRTPDPIGLEVWMASKHDPAFKPTKTRRLPVKMRAKGDWANRFVWHPQSSRARRVG